MGDKVGDKVGDGKSREIGAVCREGCAEGLLRSRQKVLGGYDNVVLHGLGSSINCLGRRVASYTTRDPKEIAKLRAMLP